MIKLPFPPSTNGLFVTRGGRNKSGKVGRVKTDAYRDWCDLAKTALLNQPKLAVGPYHMRILLHRPNRRAMDCTNRIKAPEDILVACGIIPDDSLAKSVWVGWSDREPSKDAWIEIEVIPA